jgi:opacity protein-like surface antigen
VIAQKRLISLLYAVLATPLAASAAEMLPSASSVEPAQIAQAADTKSTRLPLDQQPKGFYATLGIGANWPQTVNVIEITNVFGTNYGFKDQSFSGISGEVGLGYDFGSLRAEVTYAYDGSSLSSYTDEFGTYTYSGGDTSKNSVFVSGYWDINLKSRWTPYLGAGLGYSKLNVGDNSDPFASYPGYNPGEFGYQFKAGVSYLINPQSDVFAEAFYRGMSGFNVSDADITYRYGNFNAWGFQLGGRVRFKTR